MVASSLLTASSNVVGVKVIEGFLSYEKLGMSQKEHPH
jgi:hypothetical protein